MLSGTHLGESLIWEYGPDVRVERGFAIEVDKSGRPFTDDRGMPIYLWHCYQRTGAADWDEARKVGKHPINGADVSVNEFWIEIGKGSEDEMDALAQQHVEKLRGA
jgi:hypothetical protein